jgi:hypothetical protein
LAALRRNVLIDCAAVDVLDDAGFGVLSSSSVFPSSFIFVGGTSNSNSYSSSKGSEDEYTEVPNSAAPLRRNVLSRGVLAGIVPALDGVVVGVVKERSAFDAISRSLMVVVWGRVGG